MVTVKGNTSKTGKLRSLIKTPKTKYNPKTPSFFI